MTLGQGLGRALSLGAILFGVFTLLACAGIPGTAPAVAADGAEVGSPWSFGLVLSIVALLLGGAAAVLGIWVGRDHERPIVFALALTWLIGSAVCTGILQGYLDSDESVQRQADLDRMLEMVDQLAETSGDPELAAISAKHKPRGKK